MDDKNSTCNLAATQPWPHTPFVRVMCAKLLKPFAVALELLCFLFGFNSITLSKYALGYRPDKRSRRGRGNTKRDQMWLLPSQSSNPARRWDKPVTDKQEGGSDSGVGDREKGDSSEARDRSWGTATGTSKCLISV